MCKLTYCEIGRRDQFTTADLCWPGSSILRRQPRQRRPRAMVIITQKYRFTEGCSTKLDDRNARLIGTLYIPTKLINILPNSVVLYEHQGFMGKIHSELKGAYEFRNPVNTVRIHLLCIPLNQLN